jgi:hypothetical protein
LLQCRRRQAGLATLIAEQEDLIVELRRTGMVVLTRWIQPPFQDVSGDYERSRDDAITTSATTFAEIGSERTASSSTELPRCVNHQPEPDRSTRFW